MGNVLCVRPWRGEEERDSGAEEERKECKKKGFGSMDYFESSIYLLKRIPNEKKNFEHEKVFISISRYFF